LVNQGAVVGEGWHMRAGEPHAEVYALQKAGQQAHGATAYVTLEPCSHTGKTPPCADALVKAGVARVVVAMTDPNPMVSGRGIARLQKAGIIVDVGCLEAESRALNLGFITRMTQNRPFIRIKSAMSLDGATALADGSSQWITGAAARQDVQHLRAEASVILTGAGTVIADDPQMTVRLDEVNRQPRRVIIDQKLQTPLTSKIFQNGDAPLMLAQTGVTSEYVARYCDVAEVVVCDDLAAMMAYLATLPINLIHVEAGARLSGALVAQGWYDELVVYIAPKLMGSASRPHKGLLPSMVMLVSSIRVTIKVLV
jgi:diaminohydroxyphosphoribosylaminopyrimidine deaminase / 5-amino-6-(5-phosphoribosylamino)uracil reductase